MTHSLQPYLLPDVGAGISHAPAEDARSALGQYMTPEGIASFMASLLPIDSRVTCNLLDAGTGKGALTAAFLKRWTESGTAVRAARVDAFEVDDHLAEAFQSTLRPYRLANAIEVNLINEDFIVEGTKQFLCSGRRYSHAILNPPYKKISSDSLHRRVLRQAGIETVNLYSAFVAVALALLEPHGSLVAIVPRSFCNGPYYRPFRDLILKNAAIRHIHLFAARDQAFKSDGVLQENVIVLLEKGAPQDNVTITTSTDGSFRDVSALEVPFNEVVAPSDHQHFIHIPTAQDDLRGQPRELATSLADLGLEVSTGPVVDFRMRDHLRQMPTTTTVPLLYPGHFPLNQQPIWPKSPFKKANAIELNPSTQKWLYPAGYYVVVRRFTAKEERRRLVANVVDPNRFGEASWLAFENHLNVFHVRRAGLPAVIAYGLASFLNGTTVDEYFRKFNGHTQVNATDLRQLKYPSRRVIELLGEWSIQHGDVSQEALDAVLTKLIS